MNIISCIFNGCYDFASRKVQKLPKLVERFILTLKKGLLWQRLVLFVFFVLFVALIRYSFTALN